MKEVVIPIKPPQTFVVTDPRDYDGDPYEVADRAAAQAAALTELTITAVEDAEIMARNAEMERMFDIGSEPDASGWSESAAGKRWHGLISTLGSIKSQLGLLRRVAAYNPKRPPKE